MKITRLLGGITLAFTAIPAIEAKISRAEHNRLYASVSEALIKGRKLIIGATPENAAENLTKIQNLKKQANADIAKLQTGGWPTAATTLNKQLSDTLGDKHLTSLQNKIKQVARKAPIVPDADPLLTQLETHILPQVLQSFKLTNSVSQSDKEIRLKRISQIAPKELESTVQKLALRDAPIPQRGEFSKAAQNMLIDWVNAARTQNPGKEKEYLQRVIRHTDSVLKTSGRLAPRIMQVEEDAARALLLARLIRESRDRIASLIEGIDLE